MRGHDIATAAGSSATPPEHEFPLMISVDDHVFEPREVWQEELPARLRDRGPRVVRERAKLGFSGGRQTFELGADDGARCDVRRFDDLPLPVTLLNGPAGIPPAQQEHRPATYEDFRPGTWDQAARLADMDRFGIAA